MGLFYLSGRQGRHGSRGGHASFGNSSHHYYSSGHYYRQYHPIYYSPYLYYPAPYSVSYIAPYYSDPYVYSDYGSYNVDVELGTTVPYVEATGPPAPVEVPYETNVTQPTVPENILLPQGHAAFRAGDYDRARGLYARAMLMDERDGYAKLLFAVANFATGDYQVAETALRRAILTTPRLLDFPVDLRGLFAQPAIWDQHLHNLAQYVAEHPKDPSAAMLLAFLRYSTGDPSGALVVVDRLAKFDPTDELAAELRQRLLNAVEPKAPAP